MDEIQTPPAAEIVTSPAGGYRFIVTVADDWQHRPSYGELLRLDPNGAVSLWKRALPQAVRPRFALVSDRGRVVLLDDWWNVRSGRAVMLVGRDGEAVATWTFDAVAAALGRRPADVVAAARHGAWVAAPPSFDPAGLRVLVPAGGRVLAIDAETGALTVSD